MSHCVLDTNIIIYHLAGNSPEFSPRCTKLFQDLVLGNVSAFGPVTAISEATFVLERAFGISRMDIALRLRQIVLIEAIDWQQREKIVDALDLWETQPKLSWVDCFHKVLATTEGSGCIYSFDKHTRRLPGVERIEP